MRLFSDVASRVDDPYLAHAVALAAACSRSHVAQPARRLRHRPRRPDRGRGLPPARRRAARRGLRARRCGRWRAGADVYVTLEPCAHHGKTPPCADALIAAGVARVVIGMRDPNAEAAGGAERLARGGHRGRVRRGPAPVRRAQRRLAQAACDRACRSSTVKSGLSLDARVAFAAGERASITGPSGAEVTRRLRARADAVLVSAATVTADDPALTVRDARGALGGAPAAARRARRASVSRARTRASSPTARADARARERSRRRRRAGAAAARRPGRSLERLRWRLQARCARSGDHGVGERARRAGSAPPDGAVGSRCSSTSS